MSNIEFLLVLFYSVKKFNVLNVTNGILHPACSHVVVERRSGPFQQERVAGDIVP